MHEFCKNLNCFKPWKVKTRSSLGQKPMVKPIGIESKFDEVDKFWNTTLYDYEKGPNDDKESSAGDENDHRDCGAQLLSIQ